jgi:hypothetical protein
LTERCSEKFGKKLIGGTDISDSMQDALKRLDKLIFEEARMAAAKKVLKATHVVDEGVLAVDDRVASVDENVAGVICGA